MSTQSEKQFNRIFSTEDLVVSEGTKTVTKNGEAVEIKVADILIEKEKLTKIYESYLPEGISLKQISAIGDANQKFLTDFTSSAADASIDLVAKNKDLAKLNFGLKIDGKHAISGVVGITPSITYPGMNGGDPVTTSKIDLDVTGLGLKITGNDAKQIKSRLSAAINK